MFVSDTGSARPGIAAISAPITTQYISLNIMIHPLLLGVEILFLGGHA
jgi:hypothetical protein